MIRKTVFLLLILTGVLPFACCPEQPSGPYKVELVHVSPVKSIYMQTGAVPTSAHLLTTNETYLGDTLLLHLGFNPLLAHQPTNTSFYGAALALSCDDYPGYTYLQDKITSVEVYSDQPYHGIPAGESLSEKVTVYDFRRDQIMSLSQAITNMNTLNFYDGMEMGLGSLVLAGKPASPGIRTFTVRMAYESGQVQTVTSIPVRW